MPGLNVFKPIQDFLQKTTLSEYIESFHRPVAAVPKDAAVAAVMQTLHEKAVLSAPVTEGEGEYYGCVSVNDLLRGLMLSLEVNLGQGWVERLGEVSSEQLKEVAGVFLSKQISSLVHPGDMWMKGDYETTLMEVILQGFRINRPVGHHRIFVCDPAKQEAASEAGSGWCATDVCSQSDMIRLLHQHKDLLDLSLILTVDELDLFMGKVMTVTADTPILAAFEQMAVDYKSCLGVTDPTTGKLIGNLSSSDLRYCFSVDRFSTLLTTSVGEFIRAINGQAAAPELVKAGKWVELMADLSITTVTEDTNFETFLDLLVAKRLHRVYVIDAEGLPQGIVSLSDVLRAVVRGVPDGEFNLKRVSSTGGSNPNSRRNSEAVRRPAAGPIKEAE